MTIDIGAFASAATAATSESTASARALRDAPFAESTAGGDPLPSSADACFAALLAWLAQVTPPGSGDAIGGAAGDRARGAVQTAACAPVGVTTTPVVASAAPDARDPSAAGVPLARTLLSIVSANQLEPSAALGTMESLPTHASESPTRPASPIDLSFLSVASAAAPSREPPAAPIATVVEQRAQFASELGQRVVTMVEQGVHDVRLRVHPEHLGPIEIRVRLDGDSAQVAFHSAHAAVRDALADAVPRLRELLGAAGFGLGHVDIGAGDPQSFGTSDGQPHGTRAVDDDAGDPGAGSSVERDAPERIVALTHGLVDTFA